jgi:hypothetical protein
MSSINFNPGMSGYISVQTEGNQELYRKEITSSQESDEFIKKYTQSKEGWGLLLASFIPTRTSPSSEFAQHLFFPTLCHFASKVHNCVVKFFVSLLAIAWDLLTLAPRLITAPFRACSNRNEKEHPLVELVKDHPKAEEAIKSGVLQVTVHHQTFEVGPNPCNADSVIGQLKGHDKCITVYTKTLPCTQKKSSDTFPTIVFEKSRNEPWRCVGKSETSLQSSALGF